MPAAIEAVCTLRVASGCCAAAERQLNISTRLAVATTFMIVRRIDLHSFLSSYACSTLTARVGLLYTPDRLAHLSSFRRWTPGTAAPSPCTCGSVLLAVRFACTSRSSGEGRLNQLGPFHVHVGP